jgi:hypothetical protein
LKEPGVDFEFDVRIAMDNQTIMLVENDSTKEKLIVILFDLYTLDKITEIAVNTVSSVLADTPDYDEYADKWSSDYSSNCPTVRDFPKISCWSNGHGSEYILVGVGAKPDSKIIYEFRVYDSQSGSIIGNFNRLTHEDICNGKLVEAEFHKDDPDKIIFIFSNSYSEYSIVEADVIHNDAEVKTSITSNDLNKVKIAEDLSYVYVLSGKYDANYRYSQNLYTVKYGSDLDLTNNAENPIKHLGGWVYGTQIVSNSLIVYYERSSGTLSISMFDGQKELFTVDPSFDYTHISNFSYVPEKKQMYLLLDSYGSRINFWRIAVDKSTEDQILSIDEESMFSLSYPYYVSIKGQREIIMYNIAQKRYVYAYFPCPIIWSKVKENYHGEEECSIEAIMDLGNHYTVTSIRIGFSSTVSIYTTIDLNYMDKDNFPNDKFMKFVGR